MSKADSDPPENDQEAILTGAREYVRTTAIAETQKKSSKKRKRVGGTMHKRGAHWYGLEAYFDPKLIEATPIEDSGFMLGVLEGFVVVEYKKDMTMEAIEGIGERLNAMGLKVMMVPEGIRFMRLCAVGAEQNEEMNRMLEDRIANEAAAKEQLRNDLDS